MCLLARVLTMDIHVTIVYKYFLCNFAYFLGMGVSLLRIQICHRKEKSFVVKSVIVMPRVAVVRNL
jgi:hypothetical protein